MNDALSAGLALGFFSMEKNANIVTKTMKWLSGIPVRIGKSILAGAGQNPLEAALLVGLPVAMGPEALLPVDPEHKERAMRLRRLAQEQGEASLAATIGRRGSMMRKFSAVTSEDVREANSIRGVLEKKAGAAGPLGNIPMSDYFIAGALMAAGATATGLASAGVVSLAQKGMDKARLATRDREYKAMLKADPGLKSSPLAKEYFGILHRASPYIAGEPYVAAATVRQMLEQPSFVEGGPPGLTSKVLKELLETEASRGKAKDIGKPLQGAFPKVDLGEKD